MISERTKALLTASAAIYAAKGDWANHAVAVEDAYALLAAIEQREKQNAPKTTERCTCPPGPWVHLPACPRYEE